MRSAAAPTPQSPVLLIAPPLPGQRGPLFPRGITSIASFLRAHGIPAEVLPLSHSVDDSLQGRARVRTLRTAVRDALRALRPRALGITVPFTHVYPDALAVARWARAESPGLPIVLGGPHVTFQDRQCLEEAPEVDAVVRGEGEWAFLELVQRYERGDTPANVRGVTWRAADGSVRRNRARPVGDLLELPPLDFGALPASFACRMEVYGIASRGCAFRCRFCAEFRLWRGAVRRYPVERIVGEIERLTQRYGNPPRSIDDSMLRMDEPYFYELCEALQRSPTDLPAPFAILSRLDTLSPEGLAAMRRAGVTGLMVGLESGSQKVLDAMGKGVTLADALAGLRLAADSGVATAPFLIVGHPGDDPYESERTLRLVEQLLADGAIAGLDPAVFTPYPGTVFFHHPERHGVRILTRDWRVWSRNDRPVAETTAYGADAIYGSYLRLLRAQAR